MLEIFLIKIIQWRPISARKLVSVLDAHVTIVIRLLTQAIPSGDVYLWCMRVWQIILRHLDKIKMCIRLKLQYSYSKAATVKMLF